MSRPPAHRLSAVLAVLTDEPTSTSDLYDRVGYLALTRAGLVQYRAFREALSALRAEGVASSETAADGSTLWRRSVRPGP
jgi:hypothetical protein